VLRGAGRLGSSYGARLAWCGNLWIVTPASRHLLESVLGNISPYPIKSTTAYRTTPYHTTPHNTTPHHTTPRYYAPHRLLPSGLYRTMLDLNSNGTRSERSQTEPGPTVDGTMQSVPCKCTCQRTGTPLSAHLEAENAWLHTKRCW
jgi:hypothetical protein